MRVPIPQVPPPAADKHSFDGACAPKDAGAWSSQFTFSVGVFQWQPKASGTGLKRSAVKVRIKGVVSDAEKVYEKALEVCRKLDAGETVRQKSITV